MPKSENDTINEIKSCTKLQIIKAGNRASIQVNPFSVNIKLPHLKNWQNIEIAKRIYDECYDELSALFEKSEEIRKLDISGNYKNVGEFNRKVITQYDEFNIDSLLDDLKSSKGIISKYEKYSYNYKNGNNGFCLYFKNDCTSPKEFLSKDEMIPVIDCNTSLPVKILIDGIPTDYHFIDEKNTKTLAKGYILIDGKTENEVNDIINNLNIFCDKENTKIQQKQNHKFLEIPMSSNTAKMMLDEDMIIGYGRMVRFGKKYKYGPIVKTDYKNHEKLKKLISDMSNSELSFDYTHKYKFQINDDVKHMNYNIKCAFGTTYGKGDYLYKKSGGIFPIWDVTILEQQKWNDSLMNYADDISDYVMDKLGLPYDNKQHIFINTKKSVIPDRNNTIKDVDFIAFYDIDAPRNKIIKTILEAVDDISDGKYRVCKYATKNINSIIERVKESDIQNAIQLSKEYKSTSNVSKHYYEKQEKLLNDSYLLHDIINEDCEEDIYDETGHSKDGYYNPIYDKAYTDQGIDFD